MFVKKKKVITNSKGQPGGILQFYFSKTVDIQHVTLSSGLYFA